MTSVCLILAAAAVAFCNVFPNAFHLDDLYRVVGNPGIHQVAPISRHFFDASTMSTLPRITAYRPLLPLTLSLNYWWGGESPASYHAVNLAFHAASAALLYFVILELGAAARAALAAALLFAVHPVSGIVVNYVSARDLAMVQTFMLASLLGYVRMRRRGRDSVAGWSVALLFALLAAAAKPNALVFPILIAAYELVMPLSGPWRARLLRPAAFVLAPAAFIAWTRLVVGSAETENVVGAESGGPLGYALAQSKAHLVYLANFAWPVNLRQMPLLTPPSGWIGAVPLLAIATLVGSLLLAWRIRRSSPAIAFCILGYWILMAPESSVVPLFHLRVDYRPYPSSAFLFGALAMAGTPLLPRRAFEAATAALVAALIVTSIFVNRTWRTEETLWTHSTRLGGDAVAHMNLAMSIANRRDPRVRANLEHALAIAPGSVLTHINYGLLLLELGESQRGLQECLEAVRLAPGWGETHYWLSAAYERLSMREQAADEALLASRIEPRNLQFAYGAAQRAQAVGRYQDSLPAIRRVIAIDERYQLARFLEGFALQKIGAVDESIAAYRRFLGWNPEYAQAHFNLAYALMEQGNCAAAVPEFERTLALRPSYAEVQIYLQRCRR